MFPLHNNFELKGIKRHKSSQQEKIDDFIRKVGISEEDKPVFAPEPQSYLVKAWWNPIIAPATKIKNYYGEKIGMFFSFISFYTLALIIPTVIGTPIFILQLIDGKTGWLYSISTIVYTASMIIWSTLFYELWK